MKGLFITFEGVEGCGKTTQIARLRTHLEGRGHRVEVTREPGGTAISEHIRALLLDPENGEMSSTTELFLYEAARAQLVDEFIRPALEEGVMVLCDRFADSATAYQGAGRGLDVDMIVGLHKLATRDTWPDLTLLLDVPPGAGLQRKAGKDVFDRIERESLDFHERVRAGYLALAEREPERICVVDGARDVEAIAADIAGLVDRRLEGE